MRFTLHLPVYLQREGDTRTVLYEGNETLTASRLSDAVAFYGDRLHRVVLSGMPSDIGVFSVAPNAIFVVPITFEQLLSERPPLEKLRGAHILFELRGDAHLIRLANHLTAQGFPVRVPLLSCMDAPEVAGRLLEFYLHNRSLSVPVDPFHTLFSAACAGRTVNFWKMASVEPSRDIYFTEDGSVGPSAVLLEKGIVYGASDHAMDRICRAEQRSRLLETFADPTGRSEICGGCSLLDTCRAFLAIHDRTDQCDAWRSIHRKIVEKADRVRTLVSQLRSEASTDG